MADTAKNATPPVEKTAEPMPALMERAAMPPALALWFDDRLFDRARLIAKYLSEAQGFVPSHLLGKTAACFAVVERALTWNLSPYAVANSTYETPGGRVGFEGKLCQAILENSGKLVGGVKYRHVGDWAKVTGKFEIRKGQPKNGREGKDYPHRLWGPADAAGLSVIASAQVRGEADPREIELLLVQCFPLNSTLWATDPKTQICYTAVRRLANVALPGIFMGTPFDDEAMATLMPGDAARDITPPRPTRADVEEAFSRSQQREQQRPAEDESQDDGGDAWEIIGTDGEIVAYTSIVDMLAAARKQLAEPLTIAQLDGWWSDNAEAIEGLGPDETELAAQAQIREMLAQAKESAARRDRRPEPQQQDGAVDQHQGNGGDPPKTERDGGQKAADDLHPPAAEDCRHPRTALYGDGSEVCRDCQVVVKPAPAPAPAQQQAQPAGDLLSRQEPKHDYPELYRSLREGLDTLNTIGDVDHFLRLSEEQVDALRGDRQLFARFEAAVGDRKQALTRGKRR